MLAVASRLVEQRRARGLSPALLTVCATGVVLLVVAVVGIVVDPDRITGAPAWLKPAKFAISIAIYCATVAWLLTMLDGHRRAVRVITSLNAVGFLGEFALIDLQVVRGTTSHFNTGTAFDSSVFAAMGVLISLVFVAGVMAAILLVRQRSLPAPARAAVVGGLLVALTGMAEAILMFLNTEFAEGGGHTVGAADGGPGLPVTGWSTQHGDLRVAHFVGIHGLQAVPVMLWLLVRLAPSLTDRQRARLVVVGACGYVGLIVLLAWQAERGQSVIRPDLLTVAAAVVLVVATLAAALVPLRASRVSR